MGLTKVSTDGVKDDAVTTDKLANAINTERTANTAKVSTTINSNADNRVITGSGTANTLNGESTLTYANPTLEINTDTSPYGSLNLNGNSGGLIQFEDNEVTKWSIFGDSTFSIFDNVGSANRLNIDSSGNVGIGNTSGGGRVAILAKSTSYQGLELQTPSGDSSGEFHIGVRQAGASSGRSIVFRRGGTDGMDTQTLKLSSDGKLMMGNSGSLDMGFGPQVMSIRGGSTGGYAGNAAVIFGQTDNNASVAIIYASASDYASNIIDARSARTNNSAYSFIKMSSSSGADIEFNFRGDGNGFADGSFSGGGADYAEYFEWSDGNSSDEDRRGYTVVLDGNKIRKSTSSDTAATIIGVVSGNPSVIGDGDLDKWKQKYKKDDYGSYLRDSNGERILNPNWDESLEYVSREDRKEWSTVGLMGKIRIRKGQTMGTNWIKMQDISDTVEEWLVK